MGRIITNGVGSRWGNVQQVPLQPHSRLAWQTGQAMLHVHGAKALVKREWHMGVGQMAQPPSAGTRAVGTVWGMCVCVVCRGNVITQM